MAKIRLDKSLHPKTRSYLKEVIKKLADDEGNISDEFVGSINILTEQYNTFIIASEDVRLNGILTKNRLGEIVPNPSLKIRIDANIQVFKILKEFGLTLDSGKRLNTTTEQSDSPLMKFIKGSTPKKEKR